MGLYKSNKEELYKLEFNNEEFVKKTITMKRSRYVQNSIEI